MQTSTIDAIQSKIAAHPGVLEVVAVRKRIDGSDSTVAYVVPDPGYSTVPRIEQLRAERVKLWQRIWDMAYREATANDYRFNTAGWKSSYSGEPIPALEMREWLDVTTSRILSQKPKQVLEIGCGLGLLLFGLAPKCKQYTGLDFSENSINYLQKHVASSGIRNVSLLQRSADDLTQLGTFDTILMNSVAQYLPSASYLRSVIENSIQHVAPGGVLFLGDIRSLPLLGAFRTSVESSLGPASVSMSALRRKVRGSMAVESELLCDPAFFYGLQTIPRVSRVEIHLRRGQFKNEMSAFRYDALVFVDDALTRRDLQDNAPTLDWSKEGLSLSLIQQRLAQSPPLLAVTGIPNARVRAEVSLIEQFTSHDQRTIGDFAAALDRTWIDPMEVWKLGESANYQVDLSWPAFRRSGAFDAYFSRTAPPRSHEPAERRSALSAFAQTVPDGRDVASHANNPLLGALASDLLPELAELFEADGTQPLFSFLDRLPRNPEEVIDRRALPELDLL